MGRRAAGARRAAARAGRPSPRNPDALRPSLGAIAPGVRPGCARAHAEMGSSRDRERNGTGRDLRRLSADSATVELMVQSIWQEKYSLLVKILLQGLNRILYGLIQEAVAGLNGASDRTQADPVAL